MHKITLTIFLALLVSFATLAQSLETSDKRTYAEIGSIQELRNSKEGEYYSLINEVVLTFQQEHRNQKYIQDATAAILIEDTKNFLNKAYNTYDGITGITGMLTQVDGVKVFIPSIVTPVISSVKNKLVPITLSLKDYLANPKAYESQLIRFKELSFPETDGSMSFATGRDYDLTDGGNYLSMRNSFYKADYIGKLVPNTQVAITGIASHFNNKALLLVRDLKDLETNSKSTNKLEKEQLSIYPNPATDKFYITGSKQAEIEIFSVIGKQVARAKVANKDQAVSLQNLKPGVYMVRISQEGTTTTKKLIIK